MNCLIELDNSENTLQIDTDTQVGWSISAGRRCPLSRACCLHSSTPKSHGYWYKMKPTIFWCVSEWVCTCVCVCVYSAGPTIAGAIARWRLLGTEKSFFLQNTIMARSPSLLWIPQTHSHRVDTTWLSQRITQLRGSCVGGGEMRNSYDNTYCMYTGNP